MKIVVLGGGPAGYVAAIRAAQLGANVCVVEDKEIGGTCLNRGCIPTKAMVASAEMLLKAKNLEKFGLDLEGSVEPNFTKIVARRDKIVMGLVKGVKALFKHHNITLKSGRGVIKSKDTVEVSLADGSTEILSADKILIATGSRPAEIASFPFNGTSIISSDGALNLDTIPESILIVGAGVIGCEFASIFASLGSKVTIVEMLPRAVATEDSDISKTLEREFKKRKIKLMTGVGVKSISTGEANPVATLTNGENISAQKVLVAIGREVNTSGLGFEDVGVAMDDRGHVKVNERMQTSVEGIYAAGDVVGGMLLAHVASKEGIIAIDNALGNDSTMKYNAIPSAIFTSPEIASVGLRDFEAIEQGIHTKTGHFDFRALGKAHAMGEIAGFVKIISDANTDKVLGVHIIGPHASDLIHEGSLAIANGLTVKDLTDTVHAHPTLSEGIMEAAEDIHGLAIHAMGK